MDLFNLTDGHGSSKEALSKVKCPVLVMGSQTDILFPVWQQKQIADELIHTGTSTKLDFLNIFHPIVHYFPRQQARHLLRIE